MGQDAKTVIETMSRYEKFFVDHMMQVELGMQTPAEINGIWKNALATVFSVTAFGIMPLVAYLSLYVVNPNPAFMLPPLHAQVHQRRTYGTAEITIWPKNGAPRRPGAMHGGCCGVQCGTYSFFIP